MCAGAFLYECSNGKDSVVCDGCQEDSDDCEAKCPVEPALAKEGERCGGFDGSTGLLNPDCEDGLICAPQPGFGKLPGAGKECVLALKSGNGGKGGKGDKADGNGASSGIQHVKSAAECPESKNPDLYTYQYNDEACACFYTFTEGEFHCDGDLVFNVGHIPFENLLCITQAEREAIDNYDGECEPIAPPKYHWW